LQGEAISSQQSAISLHKPSRNDFKPDRFVDKPTRFAFKTDLSLPDLAKISYCRRYHGSQRCWHDRRNITTPLFATINTNEHEAT